jgi:hypothetical protein
MENKTLTVVFYELGNFTMRKEAQPMPGDSDGTLKPWR